MKNNITPCCVKCHAPLTRWDIYKGVQNYYCRPCKQWASGRTDTRPRPAPGPPCAPCNITTKRNGFYKGAQRFRCPTCNRDPQHSRTLHPPIQHIATPTDGDELLTLAARALPVNLPREIKEEAQAAICCDLLTHTIDAGELTDRRTVRRYVREAYGFNDRHRFISLDTPVGDGSSTFGDLLAAPRPRPPDETNQQKIEALRSRLEWLDGDDITDCTARFKLEKEICDLLRQEDDSILDADEIG